MLREERLKFILKKLKEEGRIISRDLGPSMKVSDDTIRRDLNLLEERGEIKKVHGGAIPISKHPLAYQERIRHATGAKRQLALKALPLFKPDKIIIMDGGTTHLALVQQLSKEYRGTIFTNSVDIALVLSDYPEVETVLLGGRLHKKSPVTLGFEGLDTLRSLRADLCFLGTYALHYEFGLTIPYREEAFFKQRMIAASAKTVALATQEKFNNVAPYQIMAYEDLDILITERNIDEKVLAPYRQASVEIW